MHKSLLRKKNSNKDSAFHMAAKNGSYDVAMALMECALGMECAVVKFVKKMLRRKNLNKLEAPEFLHANNVEETPLYIAAEMGYENLVAMILKRCSSPPYSGSYGRTALHGAIISNSEVKETDENGWSPLHYATFLGFHERVLQLLDVDKSPAYVADKDRNTCLHVAAYRGFICVADVLIVQCPGCWEIANSRGENILHVAVKNQQASFVSYILREHTSISNILITEKDVDGNTPLHLMANSNCLVPELSTMVDKNALNSESSTPWGIVNDGDSSEIGLVKGEQLGVGAHLSLPKAIRIFRDKSNIKKKVTSSGEDKIEKMRRASDSVMIVATLVATVTFAAGFTIPGGYYQSIDKYPGMAVLSKKSAFQAFMISDTLALLSSVIAIFVNFWGILDGREHTLKRSILMAIFYTASAIAWMMVAFSTGTYVILSPSRTLAIAACFLGILAAFCKTQAFFIFQMLRVGFDRSLGLSENLKKLINSTFLNDED
ncbi:unnamed protein product [Ilex paraguariensis]|uniref:PGG domain-containing protein n=1 Tax=Ilex paraguariensis TaxID=185542 RepID=A0ABC8TQI9_9AQUA